MRTRTDSLTICRALALLGCSWVTACTFPVDYTGTTFQCTETAECPSDFVCWEDRCLPKSEVPKRVPSEDGSPDSSPTPRADSGTNFDSGPPVDTTTNEPEPDGGMIATLDGGSMPADAGSPKPADAGGPVEQDASTGPACVVIDSKVTPDADGDGVCDPFDLCTGDDTKGDPDGDGLCGAPVIEPRWVAVQDYPRALGAMGATTLNNVLHMVGGDTSYAGGSATKEHRTYDTTTNTYATRAAAPDAHQWGPCVLSHGNFLYSFGGWNGGGKLMRRYDPATDTWQYMAQSPKEQVWAFACGVVNGVIYIVGGSATSGEQPTDRVSAYDIASNSWTSKAVLPSAAFGLSAAAIGTKLYVVGRGAQLDIYDTVNNTWSSGPALDRNAQHAAMAAYGNSLYVFGGLNASDVDRLEIATGMWTALAPMSSPRIYAAAAVIGNQIHVIGGFTDSGATAVNDHEYLLVP